MTTDESALPSLFQQLIKDIKDTECFYWVYSNYFDIQPPTERTLFRWHHTPLFLNYDALWNPELVEDGIIFDVILKNKLPAERERIKLEYAQIYRVKRTHFGELPQSKTDSTIYYQSEADGTIYSDPNKFNDPPSY